MSDRVYSVENLNQYIKSVFDAEDLLRNIKVQGEISGLKVSGKNAYFDLKDAESQLACVIFDYHAGEIRDGDRVIASGSVRYYSLRGRMNFQVTAIQPYGVGDLYRNFLLLKERLQKEGLFDKKIPKPSVIRRIGVVTSPTGAVIHDIINIVTRRNPTVDIVLYPVKVQGIGAAEEIAQAVSFMDGYRSVDAIVVGRGGGSMEDLAAFNDEAVARAAANCKKFIVSAVGHETDFTLCDFCSDLRAPTPSAAAELLTEDNRSRRVKILRLLSNSMDEVEDKHLSAVRSMQSCLCALKENAQNVLDAGKTVLLDRIYRLNQTAERADAARQGQLDRYLQRLDLLNPAKILQRGYACVSNDRGRIAGISVIKIGEPIRVRFYDGELTADVRKTEKKEIRNEL